MSGAADTTQVVVAAHDIDARTTLDSDMLKIADVPTDSAALKDGFSSTAGLVGQITRYPLVANEQVTALKIGVTDNVKDQGLSSVLPASMRAFSIKRFGGERRRRADSAGRPGGRHRHPEEGPVGVDKAVTLIQSVEVLAVAQTAQEPIPPAKRTRRRRRCRRARWASGLRT